MLFASAVLLTTIVYLVLGALQKWEKWEQKSNSIFECGFSASWFSRYSFSAHYFFVALMFLFLDLEICLTFMFLSEFSWNSAEFCFLSVFVIALMMILYVEWKEKKLEWSE